MHAVDNLSYFDAALRVIGKFVAELRSSDVHFGEGLEVPYTYHDTNVQF